MWKLSRWVCLACFLFACQDRRAPCVVGFDCSAVPGGLLLTAPWHPPRGPGPKCPLPTASRLRKLRMAPTLALLPPLPKPLWPLLSDDGAGTPRPLPARPCEDVRTAPRARRDRYLHESEAGERR